MPVGDGRAIPSTAFEIGTGVIFPVGATLTITYDPAALPAGVVGESLQLYARSGSTWTPVPASKSDVATRTATGTIYQGGDYVIRSTPVDRIVLRGAVADGALYEGQAAPIDVVLLGVAGDTLPARALAWSSSDPSGVTVDASNIVHGISIGSATLTATIDGKAATTTVSVLPRVTADWTRATDWTTYQGDAGHSGYIDATVDPAAFAERWVVTPVPAMSFHQPTTGGGRVYLTLTSYFAEQSLLALDPANGATSWAVNLGVFLGANQATYDAGSLYLTTGWYGASYMWALDDARGAPRFQTSFDSPFGHWTAPVVVGSAVVTAGGYAGGLVGFDRASGTQTFSRAGLRGEDWTPAGTGGLAYVAGAGAVRVIRPSDGATVAEVTDSRIQLPATPVVGSSNNLLVNSGLTLFSIDLPSMRVVWSGGFSCIGMPVAGGGIAYAYSGAFVAARRETDGTVLWTWRPPAVAPPPQALDGMLLTNNVLFVSGGDGVAPNGWTVAIDLASHLTVWRYPMGGSLALGREGALYIVSGTKVVAIGLR